MKITWQHKFFGIFFLFQQTAEPNRPNSWFRRCCHSTPYIFHDQDVNMWLAKKQQGLNEGGLFQVFLEIILSMNTTQKFLGCTSLVYSFALATRLQPFKMFTKVSPYNCFSICLGSCRHAPACYLVIHIMNPAPHESMKTAVCDMIHLNQMELEPYKNTKIRIWGEGFFTL